MRISNSFSLACAASLCLGGLTTWANPDTEAQAKAREALRKTLPDSGGSLYQPVAPPPGASSEALEKAREALRQKLQESSAPAPHVGKPPAKPAPEFKPLPSLPSSLPTSKESRLAELLQLYRAEKIPPQEYHTRRAKILAEP